MPAEEVHLPWGLDADRLTELVLGDAGSVTVTQEYEIRGLHAVGGSAIVTLRAAEDRSRTVFIKLTDRAGHEVAKYRHVADAGVPVAPLVGVIDVPAGPVLVNTFLPRIGIRANDTDALLDLAAQLNSVTELPSSLFLPGVGSTEHDLRIREALVTLSEDTRDGSGVVDADRWLAAYHRASEMMSGHPTALIHHELAPQQVGWTSTSPNAQLVLVDVATAAMLPRFSDLVGLLHPLVELSGRSEDDLISVYVERLTHHTGAPVLGSDLRREFLTVRVVRTLDSLPWWMSATPPPGVASPQRLAAQLRADLVELDLA